MVSQHYRWDFIGLSTDDKPTPETSEKVTDGSTFYCADNSKLYVYCQDAWYEKEAQGGGEPYVLPIASDETLGGVKVGDNLSINSETGVLSATDTTYSAFTGTDGTSAGTSGLVPAPATTDAGKFLKADGTWDTAGGGSVNVVQTTGTSTTDVMSQDATTKLIYPIISNISRIAIGTTTTPTYDGSIAIGTGAQAGKGGIALGYGSVSSETGVMTIKSSLSSYGYGNTVNRVIRGVHAPVQKYDASNKEYVDNAIINGGTTAPTTATVGSVGTLYSCVNSGTPEIYMCTAVSGSTYTWSKII